MTSCSEQGVQGLFLSASTWGQAGVKMSAPEPPVGRFLTRLLPRAVGHPRKLNCHLSGSSLTLAKIVGREWKFMNPDGRLNFSGCLTLRLPKRDLLRKDREKERLGMARQSLKKQSSYCVDVCSCFAAGGTAQKPILRGVKSCVFLSHAGVPPSSSAGKRGPGL